MQLPRQPKPVKVTLEGDTEDIDLWFDKIKRQAEAIGANVEQRHRNIFTIYPRAVND